MDELELKQVIALGVGRNIGMATVRRLLGHMSDAELTARFEELLAEKDPNDRSGVRDIVRAAAREVLESVITGKWP
jgi:hypothetical protein